jgi:hypothetical protein
LLVISVKVIHASRGFSAKGRVFVSEKIDLCRLRVICGRNNIFCENPKHKKGLAEGSKKREV